MQETIQQIIEWGRSSDKAKSLDVARQFDAEALRKHFRSLYIDGQTQGLYGDFRRGYELTLGNEAIGVTNGSGRFIVYYRKRSN